MVRLSKNLSRHEFACKCGCGFDTADLATVSVIQSVCDHFECKVRINSGCRCEAHNAKVGGAPNSQHRLGRAADCMFFDEDGPLDPYEVDQWLRKKYPNIYGFGLYTTFNHIDTRSGPQALFGDARSVY